MKVSEQMLFLGLAVGLLILRLPFQRTCLTLERREMFSCKENKEVVGCFFV